MKIDNIYYMVFSWCNILMALKSSEIYWHFWILIMWILRWVSQKKKKKKKKKLWIYFAQIRFRQENTHFHIALWIVFQVCRLKVFFTMFHLLPPSKSFKFIFVKSWKWRETLKTSPLTTRLKIDYRKKMTYCSSFN